MPDKRSKKRETGVPAPRVLDDGLNVHPDATRSMDELSDHLHVDIGKLKAGMADIIDHVMSFTFALRDELKRIMDKPSADEKGIRQHLDEVKQDLEATIFKNAKAEFSDQFVDLVTQLSIYAILMAWIRYNNIGGDEEGKFSIVGAPSMLPGNSLVQSLFFGIQSNMPGRLTASIFTPIEKVLNSTKYVDIALNLDMVVNEFYSVFLEGYDKEIKKALGVVYTPEPVVNFIVRGIDHLLQDKFGIADGILNGGVKYLDPAAGTMAFPAMLLKQGYKKIAKAIDSTDPDSFGSVSEKNARFNEWFHSRFTRKDDGFNNVFGFEILMAPYLLGTMRMLVEAERLGATVDHRNDRIQMYLVNTLMEYRKDKDLLDIVARLESKRIRDELKDAIKIRDSEDVMVVFGNPPYAVSSQNASDWIMGLVKEYVTKENLSREEGKPNVKPITGLKSSKDDYWKFIRFAQWKIAENGKKQGIVAFITNNFYIDGKVARGMRKELRRKFDEIWIVDLHGDYKRAVPDRATGMADENIFGVRLGVAIIFAIRYEQKEHDKHKKEDPFTCTVKYQEAWGTTGQRFSFLNENDLKTMPFIDVQENLDWELTPFIQDDAEYDQFPYICDMFTENAVGIVSGADNLLSSTDRDRLVEKLEFFFRKEFASDLKDIEYVTRKKQRVKGKKYSKDDIAFADNRDWQINAALEKGNVGDAKSKIIKWMWRGFDQRYFAYYPILMKKATDQFKVMQYLLPHQKNVSLVVNSQSSRKSAGVGSNYFIAETPIEHKCNEGTSGMEAYAFPLKINRSDDPEDYSKPKAADYPNIRKDFLVSLGYWGPEPSAKSTEDVFYYIYGVLQSPAYQEKYAGLLSKDFPHVPFPEAKEPFDAMSALGRKLASIHLMKDPDTMNVKRWKTNLDDVTTGEISIKIGNYAWLSEDGKTGDVWFDTKIEAVGKAKAVAPADGAFAIKGVPAAAWQYEIGGIPQLDQWLGSRKFCPETRKDCLKRGINADELRYFIRVLNAIVDTIAMRPDLDAAYGAIAKSLEPDEAS